MPSTTAHGYPYPVGTDRVTDGDNAIQALAERIDTTLGAIASGVANVTFPGAVPGSTITVVTLPAGRFTAPPGVHATKNSGQAARAVPYASGSTNTTISLGAYDPGGNPAAGVIVPVAWIAIQV
jgi:hypothetical protein